MTKNTVPRCGVNPTSEPDSPMDALAPLGFTDLDMPGDKRPRLAGDPRRTEGA